MLDGNALVSMLVFLGVFLVTGGVAVIVFRRLDRDGRRAVERLRGLSAPADSPAEPPRPWVGLSALPKLGALLLRGEGALGAPLRARLNRAGLYSPQALHIFLGAQLVLALAVPLVLVAVPSLCGWLPGRQTMLLGTAGLAFGMLLPGWWVDLRAKKRQAELRRGLPDALDMLVLCVEGGLSLIAAVQRVTGELQAAHTTLAAEMNIAQREMQLGLSAGEALQKFAERAEMGEIRDLSAVLLQSERFGASVVKALRIHSDTCRQERQQRAEEMAQKAAVKILFPTLLCIFPATFLVVLGPAAYQIATMFSNMK